MSHHQTLKQSGLAVGLLVLVLAGSESLSYGGNCSPPTPSPCAADGVCRPVTPWGYSVTRWRSWPGESVGQPTPADAAGEGDEQGLGPYELPLPEQEDLRGPAKDKAGEDAGGENAADEAAGEMVPGEGPVQQLPGPGALPAFDPQGNQSEIPGQIPGMPGQIPGMDDAPPALPKSLLQAALAPSITAPSVTARQQTPATQPLGTTAEGAQPVRQASWQQSHSIQLINPASAIVVEPKAGSLQQAIYYEASDLGDALAE